MTPGQRIGKADPPEWRAVHRAVRDALNELADDVETIVATVLGERSVPITDRLTVAKAVDDQLARSLADAFENGARPALSQFRVNYQSLRAHASAWARDHAGQLVRSISLEQRAAIANRVADTLSRIGGRGQGPSFAVPRLDQPSTYRGLVEHTARQMKPLIGLTPAQQRYVERYRAQLEAGQTSAANRRVLSRNVRDARTLSQERIDRLVDQYGRRWRDHRARTIAATEVHSALMAGQREAAEIAVRSGRMISARLVWVGGTCPVCSSMTGQTVEVLGGQFSHDGGWLGRHPPVHPNCRCSLEIVVDNPGE